MPEFERPIRTSVADSFNGGYTKLGEPVSISSLSGKPGELTEKRKAQLDALVEIIEPEVLSPQSYGRPNPGVQIPGIGEVAPGYELRVGMHPVGFLPEAPVYYEAPQLPYDAELPEDFEPGLRTPRSYDVATLRETGSHAQVARQEVDLPVTRKEKKPRSEVMKVVTSYVLAGAVIAGAVAFKDEAYDLFHGFGRVTVGPIIFGNDSTEQEATNSTEETK